MSREGLLQECRVRVPHKSVLQERILQECPARVSHKSFAQECLLQECLPRECPTKSVPQHQGLPYAGPSADTGQPERPLIFKPLGLKEAGGLPLKLVVGALWDRI